MKNIAKASLMSALVLSTASGFADELSIEFPSGRSCSIKVSSSVTAVAFLQKLPLKLDLEDYADTERIAYLDFKLKTDGSDGYEPHRGDLCYYAPWGNLAFFKKDFRYSKDLFFIGRIDNECIAELEKNSAVLIKK